jgi:protein disulfide-isomerase
MLRSLAFSSLGVVLLVGLSQAATVQSGVNWRTNLEQAKLEAAQSKRLLLVHFMTPKCGPCKYLDQNVFCLPQVGAALEQDFVPVRIDADASPAMAAMFRVNSVPTEFIMTPEGNVLANPPIPDKADAYVSQLQGFARHYKQQAAGASSTSGQPATINPAYASLPMGGAAAAAGAAGAMTASGASGAANQATAAAQGAAVGSAMAGMPNLPSGGTQSGVTTPQQQTNPFMSTAANNRYGQAQSVYPPASQQTPSAQPSQQAATPSTATMASAGAAAAVPNTPNTSPATVAAAAAGATNATAVVAAKPQAPQLPAGSPPLAFDGYCPVTLKSLNRWSPGNVEFGVVHRGRTYLFAGAEQRDQFLANPDSFSPVFSGLDPVLLIDRQQSVDGSRAFGYRYGDSFYLFSSKETMQKFKEAPHMYAAGVRQAMNRLDASSGGTLRR